MSMNDEFPKALKPGTMLAGKYLIERVLGQGGFGITYKAQDTKLDEYFAVKEFFPDGLVYRQDKSVIPYHGERTENFEYGKKSFLEEAKTLAQFIDNKGVVRIYRYFEENNTAYFVMNYIEGKNLDAYIKEHGGRITVEDAQRILVPVMDALAAVHRQGIIHRDVTPDNIYIRKDGSIILIDFGAARFSLGDKNRNLDVILKPGFAPKEQYSKNGTQGAYTDIYSLGATFYFAVTGERPQDSFERILEDEVVPPSGMGVSISPSTEAAVMRAMAVRAEDRFQSMEDFKAALLADSHQTDELMDLADRQEYDTVDVDNFRLKPNEESQSAKKTKDTKEKTKRPKDKTDTTVITLSIIIIIVAAVAAVVYFLDVLGLFSGNKTTFGTDDPESTVSDSYYAADKDSPSKAVKPTRPVSDAEQSSSGSSSSGKTISTTSKAASSTTSTTSKAASSTASTTSKATASTASTTSKATASTASTTSKSTTSKSASTTTSSEASPESEYDGYGEYYYDSEEEPYDDTNDYYEEESDESWYIDRGYNDNSSYLNIIDNSRPNTYLDRR